MTGGAPRSEKPQRRMLTEAEPSCKNGGLDTNDNDLVMYEGDILFNAGSNIRCARVGFVRVSLFVCSD